MCQKWLTLHIQSHVVARGIIVVSFLLRALFVAKSYGHKSWISNTIIIKVMAFTS
jgi:hypothetical protein